MKAKNAKKTLLIACVSAFLCVVMLIGTTFAWFTDSVTSGTNRISAGNLDVEMFYKNSVVDTWTNVADLPDEDPKFFLDVNGNEILWEPGAVAYASFKVENVGSLALKYVLETVAEEFNTVAGTDKSLKDVLTVCVPDTVDTSSRDALIASVDGATTFEDFGFNGKVLTSGASDEFTVVIYWAPSGVDNEYNLKDSKTGSDGKALWVNLDVSLVATQATVEEDSFDNQYDKDATYPLINSAEFKTALKNKNTSDITVNLGSGNFKLPELKTTNKNIVIKGGEGTKISSMEKKTNAFVGTTFEEIEFTGDIKGTFSGTSTVKNCTFTDSGLSPSCYVSATATLVIDGCEFNLTDRDAASLHFGGKDGGTVIIKNSKINGGWLAFGKAMNVTFENCEFTGAARYAGYGSTTFTNCTFSADSEVYIHASTGATDVTITMNGCTAEGGADVKSVCYNTGNSNGGVKQFVIDGVTYNHDQMQAYPVA